MKTLLKSALWYHKFFDCNIIFEHYKEDNKGRIQKIPVHGLRPCRILNKDLYAEKMSKEDIIKLYNKIKSRRPTGIGIICNLSEENAVFLDFDSWQHIWKDKKEAMKYFAREGHIVYETPRGFRVIIMLEKNTQKLGDLEIRFKDKHVGEGGGTRSQHKWTVPPSFVLNKDFYYSFVDINGNRYKYPWEGIKRYVVEQSWKDFVNCLYEKTGILIVPRGARVDGKKISGKQAENILTDPRRRRPMLPDYGIFSKIKQEFSKLPPWPHAIVALGILANEAGCRGFTQLLDQWTESGIIPVKMEILPNGRGSHRSFESVLFVLLRELGYPVTKAEEIAEKIKYPDGPENTMPAADTIYRYDHQSIIPLSKMTCPYGDLGQCWCASKPDWRVISWVKRHPDKALQIIRYVKRLTF